MSKGLFITGTGTDVGKTYVTALLAKKLKQDGLSVAYYKAAMSGNVRNAKGKLIPGDAVQVISTAGLVQSLSTVCPYVYEHAVSPHLAAKLEGNSVDLSSVVAGYAELCAHYDAVLMEGAGGILCPLRNDAEEKLWTVDLIRDCHLNCLLVADAGLGAINAVGLSAYYMKKHGIILRGLIFNRYEPGNLIHEDNRRMCEALTGAKVIACVKTGDKELALSTDKVWTLLS